MAKPGLFEWIRKTSFLYFFVYWILAVIIFGILYWFISIFSTGLAISAEPLTFTFLNFFRGIYASLLMATLFGTTMVTTAGIFTVLMYIQVAFTLIVLFILVDKIVQKWVAPHHGIHHQDKKIHSVMLMMSIFRNDVDRVQHSFRSRARTHISTKEIEAIIDGLYVAFLDVEKLVSAKNLERHAIRNIQYLMITENIQDSLEKLEQFIEFLDAHHLTWKDAHVEFWLHYILDTAEKITLHADTAKIENPKILVALHNIRDHVRKIKQKL